MRSGRVIDITPPDPHTAHSSQYIPPETMLPPPLRTTVPHLARWVGRQTKHFNISPANLKLIKTDLPGYPAGLKFLCSPEKKPKILVPEKYQERLIKATHEEILHVGYPKVKEVLRKLYYWLKMDDKIESVVRDCEACITNNVRRAH